MMMKKRVESFAKKKPLSSLVLLLLVGLVGMSLLTGLVFAPISYDKASEIAHHQPGPAALVPQKKEKEGKKGAEVAHLLQHAEDRIDKNKVVKKGKWIQPEIPVVPAVATKPFPPEYMGEIQPLDYDFRKHWKPPGKGRFVEYLEGDSPYEITDDLQKKSDELARSRREHVKRAFQTAWEGYEKYAFGKDEIHPKSKKGSDNFDGFGVTLVETLDTLWMFGMKEQFEKAKKWCENDLRWDRHIVASMYELTVLDMGGLLAAWQFSKEKALLAKAYDLAHRLGAAFLMTSSGIPFGLTDIVSGNSVPAAWDGLVALAYLSDFLSIQLEYRFLDYAKKFDSTAKLRKKAESMYDFFQDTLYSPTGLYPTQIQFTRLHPRFNNQFYTMGDLADSAYEYMLKVWIQGNRKEKHIRELYDRAMQGMHEILLQKSTPTGYTYIASVNVTEVQTYMEHRTCAQAGVLALGAHFDPKGRDSPRAQRDLRTAKALMYTCYQMNAFTPVGLAPEAVQFTEGLDFKTKLGHYTYPLRGSTVESLYVLHQVTKDPIYREWAWELFQSLEKFCRVGEGYGSYGDVKKDGQEARDRTPVTFFGETLKYFFLIFDPDSEIDIVDKPTHVFNTVGHPLKVFPKKFK